MLAPARFIPQSNIKTFAIGSTAGATKGAATGTAVGLAYTGVFALTGAAEAVIAPYLLVVSLPVMATGGALAGKAAAISEEDAVALDEHIRRNLAVLKVSDELSRRIADTAKLDAGILVPLMDVGPTTPGVTPDYRASIQQEANSVLEVNVNEVGFTGGKQLRFYMIARARVIRVQDNQLMYEREFVYQSDEYPSGVWARNRAALMQEELRRAYTSLAESVVEQVFLLTELPLVSKSGPIVEEAMKGVPGYRETCGLAWISPVRDYHPAIKDTRRQYLWNRFPTVNSRKPTFSWEAFPRSGDAKAAKDINLAAVAGVRYDLRVWQVSDDLPPRLVYERQNLEAPIHTLNQTLQSKSRYFWSARARFELSGKVRATNWGYYRTPYYLVHGNDSVKAQTSPGTVAGIFVAGVAPRDPCTLDFIPTNNYYRFQTP